MNAPSMKGSTTGSPRTTTSTSNSASLNSANSPTRRVLISQDVNSERMGKMRDVNQLNPNSAAFEPFSMSTAEILDSSNLSLSDKAPSVNSDGKARGEMTERPADDDRSRIISSGRTLASSCYTPTTAYTPRSQEQYSAYNPNTPWSGSTDPELQTPRTPVHARTGALASVLETPQTPLNKVETRSMGKRDLDADLESVTNLGRYLLISNIPRDWTAEEMRDLIASVADFKAIIGKHLQNRGCVIVIFYDPREAGKIYSAFKDNSLRLGGDQGDVVSLHCTRIEREIVQQTTGDGPEYLKLWEDADPTIVVDIVGGKEVALENMRKCLETIGPLLRLEQTGEGGRRFVAEFYDTRHASAAVAALHDQQAEDARLIVTLQSDQHPRHSSGQRPMPPAQSASANAYTLGSAAYTAGAFSQAIGMRMHQGVRTPAGPYAFRTQQAPVTPTSVLSSPSSHREFARSHSVPNDVFSSAPNYPPVFAHRPSAQSGAGPLYPTQRYNYGTPSHLVAMGRRMHEPGTLQDMLNRVDIAARAKRGDGLGGHWDPSDRQAIPEQNRVFPERIISGLDPRTTVMIKDVPNKLQRQELVNILAEVVPGEFDFVYLRFDFHNCCNVGYAFVNFTTVKALYEFVKAKVGKKWNLFSSEKVLQVSYANIQGKAALINKFRNSAVMDVIEPWRPQIFYSSGAMKGMPEPFPDSDNLVQRQRSAAARLSLLSPGNSHVSWNENDRYDYPANTGYGF